MPFMKKGELERILEAKLQEFDITTKSEEDEDSERYKGNVYKEYAKVVKAIAEKYEGRSDWGVSQVAALINVMAAFTIGQGIAVKKTDPSGDKELAIAEEILKQNNLDSDGALENARETEIEGKMLLNIRWNAEIEWKLNGAKQTGLVQVRYVPWTTTDYIVEADKWDYKRYKKVTWKEHKNQNGEKVNAGDYKEKEFVYRKFGGRIFNTNHPMQKLWRCLTEIDRYDLCMTDLRKINYLFASPTPFITSHDVKTGKVVKELVHRTNWRIGKSISGYIKDFKMVGPDASGVANLLAEKVALQKIISANTGVAAHFYEPEIMSNKRLSENEMEFLWANMLPSRQMHLSAYDEMMKKAFDKYIEVTSKPLDYSKITLSIQMITSVDWQRLVDVLLPLQRESIISKRTLMENIPGLDVEEEVKLLENQTDEAIEKAQTGIDGNFSKEKTDDTDFVVEEKTQKKVEKK